MFLRNKAAAFLLAWLPWYVGPVTAVTPNPPSAQTPQSTPYNGSELWYCARGSLDGSCNANNLFSAPGFTSALAGSLPAALATSLPTALASPTCFGCTAPGQVAATTLSTTQLASLFSLGINAAGMVGDGATNNNTAFASLITSLASGGEIMLPCGIYKVSTSFAVTIAAGKHATLSGAGRDCTELYSSGTTAGVTFTLGSQASSLSVRDIAITTDDSTGANTGITLSSNAVTTGTNGGAQNDFINVVFRGHDGYGVADYWGVGLSTITADNISIDRFGYYGAPGVVGKGIKTSSISSTKFEAIVNITNSIFFQCNEAVEYGAFVQGVSLVSANITDCNYGVYVPASETGLDQLAITASQLNCNIACVYELSNVPNTLISGPNLFILNAGSIGLAFNTAPVLLVVSGANTFGGANTTNTIAINLGASGGSGNIIESASFNTLLASINYAAGAAFTATGNTFTNVTNYFNGSGSVIAYGNQPEASYTIAGLPACGATTFGVRLMINNGVASPTYHSTPSTTGAVWSPVYCTGGSTWAYD
jgi:hypothetical protein